jgi:hypothetical protein
MISEQLYFCHIFPEQMGFQVRKPKDPEIYEPLFYD